MCSLLVLSQSIVLVSSEEEKNLEWVVWIEFYDFLQPCELFHILRNLQQQKKGGGGGLKNFAIGA